MTSLISLKIRENANQTVLSLFVFLALILSLSSKSASAKSEGKKVQCFDYYKRPVLKIRNDSLNDVAFADFMRYRGMSASPIIVINTKRLAKLSKQSQLFFIYHECGHHVLGHLYFRDSDIEAEQEADCYALRYLIRNSAFTFKDIAYVQSDMRKFAKASFTHLGGEERADALLKCIEY